LVPEAVVAEGVRVEVAVRLKLEVPGVPTAQAVEVARKAAKPERQELLAGIMLLDVVTVVVEEAVTQVPVLAAQERLAVRLGAEAEAEEHLILVLAAEAAQALMES